MKGFKISPEAVVPQISQPHRYPCALKKGDGRATSNQQHATACPKP